MTSQLSLIFPSAPIDGDAKATVELVGHDWRSDEDWRRFTVACSLAANEDGGMVNPDTVRTWLTNSDGDLTIKPQRLSAFYSRATSKAGFLDFSHWDISADSKGKNAGKPARRYKLRP